MKLVEPNLRCWGTAATAVMCECVWVGKEPSYTPKLAMKCEDLQSYKEKHTFYMNG